MARSKDINATGGRSGPVFYDKNPPGPFAGLVGGDVTMETPNGIAHSRAETDAEKDLGFRADEGYFIRLAMRKQWGGNRSGE